MVNQVWGDAIDGRHPQCLASIVGEGDHSGSPGHQFDGRLQDQTQQVMQVQFGRHGAADG